MMNAVESENVDEQRRELSLASLSVKNGRLSM